ncbi:diaminopimelate decarboxylase [Methanocaldococcus villosus KIN24-T80]|uniref:Diaminopimelate decarboxylase n=1 Tax=Methanocaldococcus villosus KIN24-T80 TaxID=1069083 RepID=N6VPD4_9EURY|nr:diaminopimelate decarboxylase [Methanocaldococcus villosus]ENN95740.1 diaminopimelate decarboxylase [Methanocaldococcus villosus KIN24-T80]
MFLGNDTLTLENRMLCVDGYPFKELAEKFGTPLYVISEEQIKINYRKYIEAFKRYEKETKKNFILAYAYKANSNLAVTKLLAKLGSGADVVSGGELYIAKLSGVPSDRIVFNGNCKTEKEIIMGIEAGIRAFNVDSISELLLIEKLSKDYGEANVAFRINPDVDPKTHPKIATGLKKSKFGMNKEVAKKAIKMALKMKNINFVGLHCHIGSQITDLSPFIEATKKMMEFILELKREGIEVEDLNLGGGLGIPYYKDKKIPTIEDYANALIDTILSYDIHPNLILEPGRSIVATAGYLLGKVIHRKDMWVMIDAGMNDLIRPAIYDAYHHIENAVLKEEKEVVNVAGGLCESSDVFGREREICKPEVGDVLVIFDAGAYGISMANNYNARPKPRMIMTSKRGVFIIREREEYSDLISKDIIPPHLL